jgi:hypothetical protein
VLIQTCLEACVVKRECLYSPSCLEGVFSETRWYEVVARHILRVGEAINFGAEVRIRYAEQSRGTQDDAQKRRD